MNSIEPKQVRRKFQIQKEISYGEAKVLLKQLNGLKLLIIHQQMNWLEQIGLIVLVNTSSFRQLYAKKYNVELGSKKKDKKHNQNKFKNIKKLKERPIKDYWLIRKS